MIEVTGVSEFQSRLNPALNSAPVERPVSQCEPLLRGETRLANLLILTRLDSRALCAIYPSVFVSNLKL